jgi:hypothetical protein
MTGHQKPSGQVRAKECDMHTHSQVVLQSGAEIVATAKAVKNNKDTTGAARSDIRCPTALWVVGLEETGNGDSVGKY